jgi:hypothetical protein
MNGSTTTSSATEMLQNILNNLPAVWNLVQLGFILLGAGLVVAGLMVGACNAGDSHRGGGRGPFAMCICGVLLVNIGLDMSMFAMTLYNQAGATGLSTTTSTGNGTSLYLNVALGIIGIVGLYGLGSGIHMCSHGATDSRQFFSGITKSVAGIMAINMSLTMSMLGASVGGVLQSSISTILGNGG